MLVTKQPLTSMVFFSISWKSTKIHFYFYAHSNVILYSYTINLKCKFPIMIASSIKRQTMLESNNYIIMYISASKNFV